MSIDFRNGSEIPDGYSGGVTPVAIPNTEVKPSRADYTAAAMQWENKTLPEFFKARCSQGQRAFLFSSKKTEGSANEG